MLLKHGMVQHVYANYVNTCKHISCIIQMQTHLLCTQPSTLELTTCFDNKYFILLLFILVLAIYVEMDKPIPFKYA